MKKTKLEKGITLIALIISVILLLIIAAVTIGAIQDSKIIDHAQDAASDYTRAQEKELIGLGYSEYQIAKYANDPIELTVDGAVVSERGNGWKVTFEKSGKEYILSSTGEIDDYKPVTNPYDSSKWTYAYTCTGGTWNNTQLVNDGQTTIPTNVDIVAMFYKVERDDDQEGIKPDAFIIGDVGISLPFGEGDEYKLVIDGKGNMGTLLDSDTMTGYAWNADIPTIIGSGDGSNLLMPYVTEVTICDGISNIGIYCFVTAMSLSKITMPKSSLTSIDSYAFQGCSSKLTDITIPGSVTTIGEYAFQYCSKLNNVTIENGVTTIERSAFDQCTSLTEIRLPSTVTTIGNSAFRGCELLSKVYIETISSQFNVGYEAFLRIASTAKIFVKDSAIENIIRNSSSYNGNFSYDW